MITINARIGWERGDTLPRHFVLEITWTDVKKQWDLVRKFRSTKKDVVVEYTIHPSAMQLDPVDFREIVNATINRWNVVNVADTDSLKLQNAQSAMDANLTRILENVENIEFGEESREDTREVMRVETIFAQQRLQDEKLPPIQPPPIQPPPPPILPPPGGDEDDLVVLPFYPGSKEAFELGLIRDSPTTTLRPERLPSILRLWTRRDQYVQFYLDDENIRDLANGKTYVIVDFESDPYENTSGDTPFITNELRVDILNESESVMKRATAIQQGSLRSIEGEVMWSTDDIKFVGTSSPYGLMIYPLTLAVDLRSNE